jgi:23S rRNA (cytidine1920-2'-O)/16S rRNA (cytidine1409-2'-O)-methyltransferase
VRDPAIAASAVDSIADWLSNEQGWRVLGQLASPIQGSDGNTEFLLGARRE